MRRGFLGALVLLLVAGCGQSVSGTATVRAGYQPDPYARLGLSNQDRRLAAQVEAMSAVDPCGFVDTGKLAGLGRLSRFGLTDNLHQCDALFAPDRTLHVELERTDPSALKPVTVDGVPAYADPAASGQDCAYEILLRLPNDPGPAAVPDGWSPVARVSTDGFKSKNDACGAANAVLDAVGAANTSHTFPKYAAAATASNPLLRHNPCELFNGLPTSYKYATGTAAGVALDVGQCAVSLAAAPGVAADDVVTAPHISVGYDEEPMPAGERSTKATDRVVAVRGTKVLIAPDDTGKTSQLAFAVGATVDSNLPPVPQRNRFRDPAATVHGWYADRLTVDAPNALIDQILPVAVATFAAPPPPAAPAPPPATVPGWQVLANGVADGAARTGGDGQVAVDVPGDWTVRPGQLTGENAYAEGILGDGYCGTGTSHADLAAESVAGSGPAAAADLINRALADAGYATYHPQVADAPPRSLAGGYQDYRVAFTVKVPPTDPKAKCLAPAGIVHVVAKPETGGTFALVLEADQGMPGDMLPTDVDRITQTVRPVS